MIMFYLRTATTTGRETAIRPLKTPDTWYIHSFPNEHSDILEQGSLISSREQI